MKTITIEQLKNSIKSTSTEIEKIDHNMIECPVTGEDATVELMSHTTTITTGFGSIEIMRGFTSTDHGATEPSLDGIDEPVSISLEAVVIDADGDEMDAYDICEALGIDLR